MERYEDIKFILNQEGLNLIEAPTGSGKTYTMLDDPNNYEISLESKLRHPLIIENLYVVRIRVPLRPGCNDRKLAEKIAQDEFYAYLYQRRNINGE